LRIRFGDDEQPSERPGHRRIGVGHLLRILRLDRAQQAGARLRDLCKDVLFVLGVALDRVHEIWNQVGTTLQLNFDLTLRRRRLLVERLNAVVPARTEREQERDSEPAFHVRCS